MWNRLYTVVFNRDWFAVVLIAILGLIVYYPVFGHDFQSFWDDQWVVKNVYTERGINWDNIVSIVTEFYHGQYAPVNQLYYTLLYELFGYNAFLYHTVSLAIHLMNSICVYFLIKQLLIVSGYNLVKDTTYRFIALLAALLFAIHPVSVEAVAWIAASKILLYAFFYLLALLSYTVYIQRGGMVWYTGAVFLFIISFGAKEQAVTLPLCLLLIDFIARRDFKHRKIYIEKIPLLLIALLFGYITMLSQAEVGDGALGGREQYPIGQRLVFASYSLLEYITKSLIPIKLSYIYPFPNLIGKPLPLRFLVYPVIVVGLVICFWHYLKRPWVLFWSLFFLLHIGVTLHIIPIGRFAIVADRYAYLSLIATCFATAYLCTYLFSTIQTDRLRYGVCVCLVGYLMGLGIYSNHRTWVWQNTDTLKEEIRNIIKNRKDYDQLIKRLDNK